MPVEIAKLRATFAEAAAQPDRASRDAYLDRACNSDAELRARVESLLAAHDGADGFLQLPASDEPTIPALTELPGTKIGRYKLLEQIGEGGFGVVFMAEQESPMRRLVALKIIKLGMDTRQVVARFEAERQALALMDHPNVAKVFDGGATDTGRPYFVMELVKGIPITDYCDQNRLNVRQRLELFDQVCQAIQHAHQKGLIHRDLKPTNVLVMLQDDRPTVKVIDFGVAKAIETRLTEKTLFTEFRQLIGTPSYMSPEQAAGGLDVDTRSDVYSLGVLLYELLTGSPPFDAKELRSKAFAEMQRIICEVEPPTPSSKLSTHAETLPSIAAQRSADPHRLKAALEGELDWIVMRALEKDRARRYQTAGGLAEDIDRYLTDQPVEAKPATRLYRLKKFVQRNRAGAIAVLAMSTALIGGSSLAVVGLMQARRQATIADTAAADATSAKSRAEAALVEKNSALAVVQEKEQLQRRRFYTAQMNLAQNALAAGEPARALDLLLNNRPRSNEKDLRGFEWHYLWRELHPGLHAACFHPEGVEHLSVRFAPDGKTLAVSGGTPGVPASIRVSDTDTGKLRHNIPIGANGITFLAYSPDGKKLASGSAGNCTICLWDAATGGEIVRRSFNFSVTRSIAFSPDGKQLVAGFDSGEVQLMDARTLDPIAQFKKHGGAVTNLIYSHDGARIYSVAAWGSDGVITRVHDMTLSQPEVIDEIKELRATDISPDGRFLIGGWMQGISLWNIKSHQLEWQLPCHAGTISDVKFSADGKYFVSAGREDRLAILWRLADRQVVRRLAHPESVMAVSCSAGDPPMFASLSDDGTANVWIISPPDEKNSLSSLKSVAMATELPDRKSVVLGGQFRALLHDLQSVTLRNAEIAATDVRGVSADGRIWTSVERTDPDTRPGVTVWGATSGIVKHLVVTPDRLWPELVRLSPDGKKLATRTSYDKPICVWNLEDSSFELTNPTMIRFLHPGFASNCPAIDFVFSPDSRLLAAAHQYGMVNLFDLESGKIAPLPLPEAASWATAVAFSEDGKLIATGNDLGIVTVFDIATGETQATLAGHEGKVTALEFFSDAETLAVGSLATIRLWDLNSQQERVTLRLPPSPASSAPLFVEELIAAAADRILLSLHSDGAFQIWNATDDVSGQRSFDNGLASNAPSAHDIAYAHMRNAIFHLGMRHWNEAELEWQMAQDKGVKWDAPLIARLALALPNLENGTDVPPNSVDAIRRRAEPITLQLQDPELLNAVVWDIVCANAPSQTARKIAVKSAEKATTLAPTNGALQNSLGLAYYRNGQWQAALDALGKSMVLRDGGDASDWYFLAMAHWQLGQKDEARQWFEKAIAWEKNNQPNNEELRLFHAEAEGLFGNSLAQ